MAATGGGFQLKDLIAVAALIVTIVWNYLNRRHIDQLAQDIRVENHDLEQWKATRAEIMRTLRAFEDAASDLTILATAAHDKDALIAEMDKQNRLLIPKHLGLLRELARPAFQPSWTDLAYGPVIEGESEWDRLISVLAEAQTLDDAGAIRAELKKIDAHIQAIADGIDDAIHDRDLRLHPCQAQNNR